MATKATGLSELVPPSCFGVDLIVVFFKFFELLLFSLPYMLASRNGSKFLLGPCLIFVV